MLSVLVRVVAVFVCALALTHAAVAAQTPPTPLVVAALVDGSLHAVSARSGKPLWTFHDKSWGPLVGVHRALGQEVVSDDKQHRNDRANVVGNNDKVHPISSNPAATLLNHDINVQPQQIGLSTMAHRMAQDSHNVVDGDGDEEVKIDFPHNNLHVDPDMAMVIRSNVDEIDNEDDGNDSKQHSSLASSTLVDDDGIYLPEPIGDGDLWYYADGAAAPQRIQFPIKYIVDNHNAFASGDSVFAGKKVSKMLEIDSLTGKLMRTYSSDNIVTEDWLLSLMKNASSSIETAIDVIPLFISRTDYMLSVYNRHTSELKFNITFGEYSTGSGFPKNTASNDIPTSRAEDESTSILGEGIVSGLGQYDTVNSAKHQTSTDTPFIKVRYSTGFDGTLSFSPLDNDISTIHVSLPFPVISVFNAVSYVESTNIKSGSGQTMDGLQLILEKAVPFSSKGNGFGSGKSDIPVVGEPEKETKHNTVNLHISRLGETFYVMSSRNFPAMRYTRNNGNERARQGTESSGSTDIVQQEDNTDLVIAVPVDVGGRIIWCPVGEMEVIDDRGDDTAQWYSDLVGRRHANEDKYYEIYQTRYREWYLEYQRYLRSIERGETPKVLDPPPPPPPPPHIRPSPALLEDEDTSFTDGDNPFSLNGNATISKFLSIPVWCVQSLLIPVNTWLKSLSLAQQIIYGLIASSMVFIVLTRNVKSFRSFVRYHYQETRIVNMVFNKLVGTGIMENILREPQEQHTIKSGRRNIQHANKRSKKSSHRSSGLDSSYPGSSTEDIGAATDSNSVGKGKSEQDSNTASTEEQLKKASKTLENVGDTNEISTTSNSGGTINMPKRQDSPAQGSPLVVSDDVIGYGSHGTIVYKGTFSGRHVAVKRLLMDFYEVADHETTLLQQSDTHPNVVTFYYKERREGFLYLALELCSASLQQVIEDGSDSINSDFSVEDTLKGLMDRDVPLSKDVAVGLLRKTVRPKEILLQITQGLHFLHSLQLVHRDLKPGNILVLCKYRQTKALSSSLTVSSTPSVSMQTRVLISDFGLGKKLDDGQNSFVNTHMTQGGTIGWRAPESIVSFVEHQIGNSNSDHITDTSMLNSVADSNDEVDAADINVAQRKLNELATSMVLNSKQPISSGGGTGGIKQRLDRTIDIFSLGCVFYYVLTMGGHPFGDRVMREVNILKGNHRLDKLDNLRESASSTLSEFSGTLMLGPQNSAQLSANSQSNKNNGRSLEIEKHNIGDAILAKDLIRRMISREPRKRPQTEEILRHPYFWTAHERLHFLLEVSDRLEIEDAELREKAAIASSAAGESPARKKASKRPPTPVSNDQSSVLDQGGSNGGRLVVGSNGKAVKVDISTTPQVPQTPLAKAMERGASKVIEEPWNTKLDPEIWDFLYKFRKYDTSSVKDLLRAVRNTKHHFQHIPPLVREKFTMNTEEQFLEYFLTKYPMLLSHVLSVVKGTKMNEEAAFQKYFQLNAVI